MNVLVFKEWLSCVFPSFFHYSECEILPQHLRELQQTPAAPVGGLP